MSPQSSHYAHQPLAMAKRGIARRRVPLLLLAVAIGGASIPLLAAPLAPGSLLPPLSVTDQHERQVSIEATTRFVVFAADKTASDIVSDALRLHPSVFAERRLVYIADISGMPAMVTRMFALPKLRDFPFQVGLVQNSEVTGHLPRKPKEVTLISLEDQRVQTIEYLPDAASLRRSLGVASP